LSKATLNQIPEILNKITSQLERIENNNRSDDGIAVLWDVENVNPGNDISFMEGFKEYLMQYGRLTVAQAFADWTHSSVKKIASLLSEHHFELIHVPASRKNSADMSLITYGIELALQYPTIAIFLLITGDSDFRPLVKSLRRSGKKTVIICDMKTAREDFLILADDFIDYRTLRSGGSTPDEIQEVNLKPPEELITLKDTKEEIFVDVTKERENTKEQRKNAINLLTEAISQMKEEGVKPGIGLVKVRLLMLNSNFNEKGLGFSNFSEFINAAQSEGFIQVSGAGAGLILDVKQQVKGKSDQDKSFGMLLKLLEEYDNGNKTNFHNLANIAGELYKKPKFKKLKKKLGFKKFKDFIQAAEVRKLVETKVDGLTHSVRRMVKKK